MVVYCVGTSVGRNYSRVKGCLGDGVAVDTCILYKCCGNIFARETPATR